MLYDRVSYGSLLYEFYTSLRLGYFVVPHHISGAPLVRTVSRGVSAPDGGIRRRAPGPRRASAHVRSVGDDELKEDLAGLA